jgi:hypothetical protein
MRRRISVVRSPAVRAIEVKGRMRVRRRKTKCEAKCDQMLSVSVCRWKNE